MNPASLCWCPSWASVQRWRPGAAGIRGYLSWQRFNIQYLVGFRTKQWWVVQVWYNPSNSFKFYLCSYWFCFPWINCGETVAKGVYSSYSDTTTQSAQPRAPQRGRASWHPQPCSSWSVESQRTKEWDVGSRSFGGLEAQSPLTNMRIFQYEIPVFITRLLTCRLQGHIFIVAVKKIVISCFTSHFKWSKHGNPTG